MMSLDSWVVQAAAALGLPPDEVPPDLRSRLLDLTETVSSSAGAPAGPMTGLVLGLAIGHGMAPSAALTTLQDLAGTFTERETSAPAPAGPPAPGADTTVPAARAQQLGDDHRGPAPGGAGPPR